MIKATQESRANFISDMLDRTPYAGGSAESNGARITAYVYNNGWLGMHLDCDDKDCGNNRPQCVLPARGVPARAHMAPANEFSG